MKIDHSTLVDRVARAEIVYEQVKAKLERARNLKVVSNRKQGAHQKILVGAFVLKRAKASAEAARDLMNLLGNQSLNSRERAAVAPILEDLNTKLRGHSTIT